eukprot:tig00001224_g7639.t1
MSVSNEPAELLRSLFDCHNHIIDDGAEALAGIEAIACRRMCVMSCRPSDFASTARLAAAHGERIVPAFGVHPWFAHTLRPGDPDAVDASTLAEWDSMLRGALAANPRAIVGEIGLDKAAKIPGRGECDFAQQLAVFRRQLAIAAELRRPVSMHCVRAMGPATEVLRELAARGQLPPRVMFHSYTGSPDAVNQLRKISRAAEERFYFSFSEALNGRSGKGAAAVAAVPDDRLLIESDLHRTPAIDPAMAGSLRLVAEAKGWSLAEAARRTRENAERFFAWD